MKIKPIDDERYAAHGSTDTTGDKKVKYKKKINNGVRTSGMDMNSAEGKKFKAQLDADATAKLKRERMRKRAHKKGQIAESIVVNLSNGDLLTAKQVFEEKMAIMSAKKLLEVKKMIASRLDESKMRLIGTHSSADGNKKAKVYRNSEWEEFVVKHFESDNHQKNADYHTNDKEDAHNTAKHWINK